MTFPSGHALTGAATRIDDPALPRNLLLVLIRFCLLLAVLAAVIFPLRAQDEPVHMTPEFALTFPLAKSDGKVTVKFPVLLNPATVLKPGMTLRTLYILNLPNADGSTDLVLAHHGSMEESYSRSTASPNDQSKMPPEMAHEIEGYRRTVWEVTNNFVLAMAQYPTDQMHLIYVPGSDNRDLQDERFSFFDGLLVGLPDGKVTILAVEKESHAETAGLKAGDEILAVGGIPTKNDLETFAAAYAATKKTANETSSYPMTIRSEGHSDAHTVAVPMPPSLKGGLMNGL